MESVGGYAYFVSEGTLSADLKFLFFFFLKTFFIRFSSSKTYTVNEFNYFVRLLSDCFKSKEDKRL